MRNEFALTPALSPRRGRTAGSLGFSGIEGGVAALGMQRAECRMQSGLVDGNGEGAAEAGTSIAESDERFVKFGEAGRDGR
jgi:hypothetical protein